MARPKSTPGGKGNRKNASANPEGINPATAGSAADAHDGQVTAETTADRGGREASAAAEARVAPEARKLEVVKSEPRKKVVVPINLEDEIRRRAYEIYEQRGNTPGSESEDWLIAEQEVRQRYPQQQHTA